MDQKFTRKTISYSHVVIKLIATLFVILFDLLTVRAQQADINDLLNLSSAPSRRFDVMAKKYGFLGHGISYTNDTLVYVYDQKQSSDTTDKTERQLLKYRIANGDQLAFQTSSYDEYENLKVQSKKAGYFCPEGNKYENGPLLFQKENTVISFNSRATSDTTIAFTCLINRKDLPKGKDILVAEDLLQLTSHEYLCAVFGSNNVRKDIFYISEDKTAPCSVLFPNTKMEAVFVWQDAGNYKDILALRIGGDPRTKGSKQFDRSIEQNIWQSKEGLYIGMSLQELQKIAERNSPASSSSFGRYAASTNSSHTSGRLGLVLTCLNCGNSNYFLADYSNASQAINEGKKIYISTMILVNNTPGP